ncbi:hypothetical protein L204_104921 [Cryptococcus depauperatus]|nr:ribosomal RNA-processing protein 1 [Cryptococcus depauperatus CBS 7855]
MPVVTQKKGKSRADSSQEDGPEAAIPLGKQLAHTDKKVRDKAVESLVAFLSQGGDAEGKSSTYVKLEEKEMSKLWKGLFYCFWMSDKPLVQQRLAADLAELVLQINPRSTSSADSFQASLAFLEGFWDAMVREWAGLDRLRMDKYYMLIRKYISATFRLLAREKWEKKAVESANKVLMKKGGAMSWEDPKVPTSIATHLSDIYLEELDKVLGLPEVDSQPACPLITVLDPHLTLLARTSRAVIHTRLMSSIFEPLLTSLSLASPVSISDEEPPSKRSRTLKEKPMYAHIVMHSCTGETGKQNRSKPDALRQGVLKAMFNAAANGKATETNRRKIYTIWRQEGGDDEEDDE